MCNEKETPVETPASEPCQCAGKYSIRRTAGLLAAAIIGMAVGIGITWYVCMYMPNCVPAPAKSSMKSGRPGFPGGKGGMPQGRSKRRMAAFQIRGMVKAVESYKAATGSYPAGKVLPVLDPWGNLYVLLVPGQENRAFDIISYGEDGNAGGEGENADIESWNLKKFRRPGKGPKPEAPEKK